MAEASGDCESSEKSEPASERPFTFEPEQTHLWIKNEKSTDRLTLCDSDLRRTRSGSIESVGTTSGGESSESGSSSRPVTPMAPTPYECLRAADSEDSGLGPSPAKHHMDHDDDPFLEVDVYKGAFKFLLAGVDRRSPSPESGFQNTDVSSPESGFQNSDVSSPDSGFQNTDVSSPESGFQNSDVSSPENTDVSSPESSFQSRNLDVPSPHSPFQCQNSDVSSPESSFHLQNADERPFQCQNLNMSPLESSYELQNSDVSSPERSFNLQKCIKSSHLSSDGSPEKQKCTEGGSLPPKNPFQCRTSDLSPENVSELQKCIRNLSPSESSTDLQNSDMSLLKKSLETQQQSQVLYLPSPESSFQQLTDSPLESSFQCVQNSNSFQAQKCASATELSRAFRSDSLDSSTESSFRSPFQNSRLSKDLFQSSLSSESSSFFGTDFESRSLGSECASSNCSQAGTSGHEENLCKWMDCDPTTDGTSDDLVDHIRQCHVATQREDAKSFVCLWAGCKVFDRPSCSRSWLERHVLSHVGNKPFRCIVDGCNQRFSSEFTLHRHVNGHFPKRRSRPQRKLAKHRRKPQAHKSRDFFDEATVELVRYELFQMNSYESTTPNSITFHPSVIGRRVDNSGKVKILLHWSPEDILSDSWVSETDMKSNMEKTIPMSDCPLLHHHYTDSPPAKRRRK